VFINSLLLKIYLSILIALMRKLFLVRHAKSSWDNPGLSDIDRPLNGRGKENAPKMGELLKQREGSVDLIISSPAKRARSTAKRIAKQLDYKPKNIEINELLYLADTDDFFEVIKKTPDEAKNLMLFSHNFGITYFANFISGENIDNIPTCGVVRIDFEMDSWKDIKKQKGKLVYFEYPKKYSTEAGIE
jgi:phosphohistidine phosphatase